MRRGELGDTVAFHDSSDLATQYEENDYCRGLLHGGKSIVYRESDVISEEVRSASEYYNKVYVPNGWHYSIHMVLCHEERLLGEVTLYRKQGKSDFHYDDVFLLDMLKEHLSYRLDREWKDRGLDGGKMTIKAATLQVLPLLKEKRPSSGFCWQERQTIRSVRNFVSVLIL